MSRIAPNLRPTAAQFFSFWAFAVLMFLAQTAEAQLRARLPGDTLSPASETDTSLVPVPPSSYGAASLGQPSFDPYSTAPPSSGVGSIFGSTSPPTAPSYGAPIAPQTPAWSGGVESAPPALFPSGNAVMPNSYCDGNGTIWGVPEPFFVGFRLRHGWLEGDDGREMDIHETDTSVVFRWPNFLFTQQPLFVAPSFSLYLLDNPQPPDFPPGADLPGQVYGGYIDAFWRSDPARMLGVDLGTRVGVFSDFETFTTDSIRVMGQGIVRYRIQPTLTLKAGAMYVDRADVKIIPAGGVLWEPNSQTRFDITFPQPKLAQYLTTLGKYDIWWYIMGEFGGGSWTVNRAVDGAVDRVDLNDMRLIGGLEFGGPELFREGRRLGFFEVGWVTEREGIYVRRPEDNFTIRDTIMVRAGFGY